MGHGFIDCHNFSQGGLQGQIGRPTGADDEAVVGSSVRLEEHLDRAPGCDPSPVDFITPGRYQGSHMSSRAFQDGLMAAVHESGLEGVSSHSFRRSALTSAHNAGVPLRVIRELSGHKSMSPLQRYLEVTPAQREAAAAAFA